MRNRNRVGHEPSDPDPRSPGPRSCGCNDCIQDKCQCEYCNAFGYCMCANYSSFKPSELHI
jgi:hypothetical protein